MAHLKTETLFEDLKTNIEQLAEYASQHGNYGVAEDALDCLRALRQRVEIMTRELKATHGLLKNGPKGIW